MEISNKNLTAIRILPGNRRQKALISICVNLQVRGCGSINYAH